MTTTVEPLTFELKYRREAYQVVGGSLVRDKDRDRSLPDYPPQFAPFKGDFPSVAKRADDLNKAQTRSGFMHYFFWPEPAGLKDKADPAHCEACRHIYEHGQDNA